VACPSRHGHVRGHHHRENGPVDRASRGGREVQNRLPVKPTPASPHNQIKK
jgi:hypothetical protein